MPTIFSRIISGEFPGRFVWRDRPSSRSCRSSRCGPATRSSCRAKRSTTGSTSTPTSPAHLFHVAQQIGKAQQLEWNPVRVGVMIVGEEVPHVHIHVVPIDT